MRKDILQTNLLGKLRGQFPTNGKLVKKLTDILDIEKEAVYRRLRGEVPFSFPDAMLICSELNISLDNLIGVDSTKARPFVLALIDHETPTKQDYNLCESYLKLLKSINKNKSAQTIETWNTLPFPLTYQFPYLSQFYLFKWIYLFKNHIPTRKYKEIHTTPKLQLFQQTELAEWQKFAHKDLILNSTIFTDLVNDIKHFYELELISKEEISKIQQDLYMYINYLESITLTGKNEKTGSSINIYISRIKIDLNQFHLESDTFSYCVVRFLDLGGISSIDGLPHTDMKNWLLFHKRMATLITGTGEIEKTTFFTTQHKHIQSLSTL